MNPSDTAISSSFTQPGASQAGRTRKGSATGENGPSSGVEASVVPPETSGFHSG